jgi:hypothetical protein
MATEPVELLKAIRDSLKELPERLGQPLSPGGRPRPPAR